MNQLGIGELAALVGGRLRLGDLPPLGGELEPLGRLVGDCRRIAPGDVYWELPGSKMHHACDAEEALARGAQGVVLTGRCTAPWAGRFCLEIADSRVALKKLARYNRTRFRGRMIAVSGNRAAPASEMIHAVLRHGKQGTLVDCPETGEEFAFSLASIGQSDDYALLPMACRDVGEEISLCLPHIVVITDLDGFCPNAEKTVAALLAGLPDEGYAIINGDDARLQKAVAATTANVLRVGRGTDCDLRADHIRFADGRLAFTIDGQAVETAALTRKCLVAPLAAMAIGDMLGISRSAAARTLSAGDYSISACRLETIEGVMLLKQPTSNIHATTIDGARELLSAIPDYHAKGSRVVVLGDIETGRQENLWEEASRHACQQLGKRIVDTAGTDFLLVCGKHADRMAASAREAGLARDRIVICQQADDAANWLKDHFHGGVVAVCGGPTEANRSVTALFSSGDKEKPIAAQQKTPEQFGASTMKARPLTSLLRESDVALPPG